MARHFSNWLKAYLEYSSYTEAPKHMRFWTAVSVVAGALRRRVWIDMTYWRWYANFYLILVAPPGIVAKSTTADVGMKLLRQVPGIVFGPDVVTWPALIEAFEGAKEGFNPSGGTIADGSAELYEMSAITLESSEFGNLVNPQDKEMIDLLVSLWDGKEGTFQKKTKTSGNNVVVNPWINIIACTTPAWIAGNFPEYMIGGGFTSRCLFVYAEEKAKLVAYPFLNVPDNLPEIKQKLIEDLTQIAGMCGAYRLTPEAVKFGESWYAKHYESKPAHLDDDRFGGYLARKQTHIHKLSMILAAAESDTLLIEARHLQIADQMVTDLEKDMAKVFSKIGKPDIAGHIERMIRFIAKSDGGGLTYMDAFKFAHQYFPSAREFEDMLSGCVKSGYLKMQQRAGEIWIVPGPNAYEILVHPNVPAKGTGES